MIPDYLICKDPLKEGLIEQNISPFIKNAFKNFPDMKFLRITSKPGVFILYFPSIETDQKIYVGAAKNMVRDIARYRCGSGNVRLTRLIKENGPKMEQYAIYQGKDLEDISLRKKLETQIIQQIESFCFNKEGKTGYINTGTLKPENEKLNVNFITGSLGNYQLKYSGQNPVAQGSSCIYLFLHPVTKKFYIGESRDFISARVVNRHRRNIYAAISELEKGFEAGFQGTSGRIYSEIAKDCLKYGRNLLFTIIETNKEWSELQRKAREIEILKEAREIYDGRLYNSFDLKPPVSNPPSQYASSKRTSEAMQLRLQLGQIVEANPCIIDGKWYNSQKEAARALKFKSDVSISQKVRSLAYPNYISVKNPLNKPFPSDPEIQRKVREFYANNIK